MITILILIAVIAVALAFEFINGFHDCANAIATVVSTKVLSPKQAVLFGASLEFIGALTGTHVAKTIGSGIVNADMIRSMAADPIVFPMANPVPEIMPDEALAAGAAVVGTGRSDFMNQINNVLAFPGIFRGALDVRAGEINDEMKTAASFALAELVADDELSREYILPKAFDKRIAGAVAAAVAKAARETGVSRI